MKITVKGLVYDRYSVTDSYVDEGGGEWEGERRGGRRKKEGEGWGAKWGGERPQERKKREGRLALSNGPVAQ